METPGQPSPIDPSGGPSALSLIQGGSVEATGDDPRNEPGYTIDDDSIIGNYTPGTVAMANIARPDSASAQFFIDIGNESHYFSKTYVIFGQVTQGMEVVKHIRPDDLILGITITEAA